MSGHCFAHGSFDGIHCPKCHGCTCDGMGMGICSCGGQPALVDRIKTLERHVEYLMDKDSETLT